MNVNGYLNIKSNGSVRFTKNCTGLDWNEIAMKVSMDIPDELFRRPVIEANITVSDDIIPKPQPTELILNSKELIEESTGAKINFSVVPYNEEKKVKWSYWDAEQNPNGEMLLFSKNKKLESEK